MSPTCKQDIYLAQTDALRLEMRPNDSLKQTAAHNFQCCQSDTAVQREQHKSRCFCSKADWLCTSF